LSEKTTGHEHGEKDHDNKVDGGRKTFATIQKKSIVRSHGIGRGGGGVGLGVGGLFYATGRKGKWKRQGTGKKISIGEGRGRPTGGVQIGKGVKKVTVPRKGSISLKSNQTSYFFEREGQTTEKNCLKGRLVRDGKGHLSHNWEKKGRSQENWKADNTFLRRDPFDERRRKDNVKLGTVSARGPCKRQGPFKNF